MFFLAATLIAAPEKPNFVFDDSQLGKPLQTNDVEVSLSEDGNSLVAGKALEGNDPSGCDLRILYADASSRLVYKIQYVLEGSCTSTNVYASFCSAVSLRCKSKGIETKVPSQCYAEWQDPYERYTTEYRLKDNAVSVTYTTTLHGRIEVCFVCPDLLNRFNAANKRRALRKVADDKLERFAFDNNSGASGYMPMKPFRFLKKYSEETTCTSKRVYRQQLESDPMPNWMSPEDISNEIQIIETSLEKLYGVKPKNKILKADGLTIEYGCTTSSEKYGVFLFAVSDALALTNDDEVLMRDYSMPKFLFGENATVARPGISRNSNEGNEISWKVETEKLNDTDYVCQQAWAHAYDPECMAVPCPCSTPIGWDVNHGEITDDFKQARRLLELVYGASFQPDSVSTNGIIVNTTTSFSVPPVSVALSMQYELNSFSNQVLVISGKADKAWLLDIVKRFPHATTDGTTLWVKIEDLKK